MGVVMRTKMIVLSGMVALSLGCRVHVAKSDTPATPQPKPTAQIVPINPFMMVKSVPLDCSLETFGDKSTFVRCDKIPNWTGIAEMSCSNAKGTLFCKEIDPQ